MKVLLFDFDGTICDSYLAAVEIFNNLAGEYKYKKLDEAECMQVRDLTAQEFLQFMKISIIKVPFIARRAKKELQSKVDSLRPFLGIKETILQLHENGYKLGILTSNSEKNIKHFFKKNNLEIFDFIYSDSGLFGKGKVLKKLLKRHQIDPTQVAYVGDETRDIEAARAAGIKIIAVTWGYNSKALLEKHHPNFLIEYPRQLLEL